MGGLGFIHAGFLLAGLAVAVPIFIHLLFRQKARRVDVGSLHFLKMVLQDNARRRKLRRWLLLALRMAGALLLALLFARPYRDVSGQAGREREVALVVDRSASMGAGRADRSPFAGALEAARKTIRDLPVDTTAHLAYADASGVEMATGVEIDSSLKPGPASTDFGKALAWARDLLVQSRKPSRKVFLITDLQRSGLGRTPLESFPPEIAVEVVDVGKVMTQNVAVDDVLASRTDLRPNEPVVVTARLFNAGPFVAQDVKLRLHLEGPETIDRTSTATVEGSSRQVVRFDVPIRRAGLYRGYVEAAGGDDLPFDDRRWLAFEARPADQVLLVDGDPGPSVFGNETYYLETALRLRLPDPKGKTPATSPTPFEPTVLPWRGGPALPDLAPYRVVVLANVADLPSAASDALIRFVGGGGQLVIFTGDKVKPGAYAGLAEARWLPAAIGKPAEPGAYRFASWDKEHPLLAPFNDPQHGDLRTLKLRQLTDLTPIAGARVLARATGDRPIVVEQARGKGRCVVVATAADNAWGDWAVNRLYLPLMHQIMGYLTDRLVDEGRIRVAQVGPGRGEGPGVSQEAGAVIVRNVDPRESELERASAAEIRAAYHLPELEKTATEADEPIPGPDGSLRPDEAWRLVAWALLIVLVIETFVANRTHA